MKAKEVEKTVEQQAAEIVASKKIELFSNDRGRIGIKYDDRTYNTKLQEMQTDRATINDIRKIDVTVHRGERGEEVIYFIRIYEAGGSEWDNETFKLTKDVQVAFAIKDLLDDMITEFKSRREEKDNEAI